MDHLFLGMERMTVDNKGRVGIPARYMSVLRAICPEQAEAVGVMITPEKSIKILPIPTFEAAIGRLSELNDQIEQERLILNLTASYAECAGLDKQNRIKLNPLMMEECSIDREVMITGNLKYIQIWDEKIWREFRKKAMPQLGSAETQVARRDEPKAPVQYVINTAPHEAAADKVSRR